MTTVLQQPRKHDISFYRDGRIDITAGIAKQLGLQRGDMIDIATGGWKCFLYVKKKADQIQGRCEGVVKPTNKGRHTNNFRAYSKSLTDFIFQECESWQAVPDDVIRLFSRKPVTTEYGVSIPLVTHHHDI